jgi:hypothetical protein
MALNLYLMLVSCLKILDKSLEHIQKKKIKKRWGKRKAPRLSKKIYGIDLL